MIESLESPFACERVVAKVGQATPVSGHMHRMRYDVQRDRSCIPRFRHSCNVPAGFTLEESPNILANKFKLALDGRMEKHERKLLQQQKANVEC